MRKFVLVISILTYVQSGAWGSKNPGKIKVLDAKNSRLYRGPQNPERRDLSSYILRAQPTEPSIRYFTGKVKTSLLFSYPATLHSRIAVPIRLFILNKNTHLYFLIKDCIFIKI